MRKVLVATQKPFAQVAKDEIVKVCKSAGYNLVWLEKYKDETEFCQAVADVDALIVRSDKVTGKVVQAASKLKIVVRAGAGYDNLDLTALSARNIVAMNTPGQNANGVAELAIGMLVYMARNEFAPGTGVELEGKVLGLHGFGAVARKVGAKAKALGMKVCAYDPFVKAEDMKKSGVTPVKTLASLYKRSFAVSIHVPALPSTVGSVNGKLLSNMCSDSTCIVLNTARAEIVDTEGMFTALENNAHLRYASDVNSSNDPSWDRFREKFGTRVWANQGKIGAQTAESNTRSAKAAANQIVAFFEKGDEKYRLNR